jgi:hypothetical protein
MMNFESNIPFPRRTQNKTLLCRLRWDEPLDDLIFLRRLQGCRNEKVDAT